MEVTFASKSPKQNRIGPIFAGEKEIYFSKGTKTTTDKEEIKALLSHSFYKRGRYVLVTDPELVANYLENDDEPEYIGSDFFDDVSDETILKVGQVVGAKNTFPSLIKAELVGVPVTNDIIEVMEADNGDDGDTDQDNDQDTTKTATKKKVTKKSPTKKKSTKKDKDG